jgi:hypothetical protein
MKARMKKVSALAIAAVVAFGLNNPAIAAAPEDTVITLISPVLNASNTSEAAMNQKTADGWVSNGWFGEGLKYQRTFVTVGSTTHMTYHVVDKTGKIMVGLPVNLRVNKGYSTSTSILSVDGLVTKGVDKPPLDQVNVIHITDAFGNVTFEVKNLDAAPMGEPAPESFTGAPNISLDGLNDLHSQFLPQVAGEKPDHSVITEFHYYIPTSMAAQPATKPTIRLIAPILDDKNSIHREDLEKIFSVDNPWYAKGIGVRQVYAPVGASIIVAYAVTDDNGKPLTNVEIKLHVNKAYSGSNASITSGSLSTDKTKDSTQGNDQLLLTTRTDGMGIAVFNLKNTDTVGEPVPATPLTITPVAGKGAVFSQIFPEITGAATDVADMTEFHFYADAAKVSVVAPTVTVTSTKAKSISVTIKNAAGKNASILVSGSKVTTSKITSNNQVVKLVSTVGKKTVTVNIDGKKFTSSVTVK